MKTRIEIEAEELATSLDNPCSVMIRKLLAEIEYLQKCNSQWQKRITQKKPLSDKEILDIKTLMEINYGCVPPLEFARAILRKAQEK